MRCAAPVAALVLLVGCTTIKLRMGVEPKLLEQARATGAPVVHLHHETAHRIRWVQYWWEVVLEERWAILLNTDSLADAARVTVPWSTFQAHSSTIIQVERMSIAMSAILNPVPWNSPMVLPKAVRSRA